MHLNVRISYTPHNKLTQKAIFKNLSFNNIIFYIRNYYDKFDK